SGSFRSFSKTSPLGTLKRTDRAAVGRFAQQPKSFSAKHSIATFLLVRGIDGWFVDKKGSDRLQASRPDAFERPRRCKSYLIMGTIAFSLAVASFGAFQFVRHFVLCLVISCLKPQIVGVDNRSTTYAFPGGYCFMTSKILYPTQYEHMRHKWGISALLQ